MVIGEKNSGKTTFIKCFVKKLRTSNKNQNSSYKSSLNICDNVNDSVHSNLVDDLNESSINASKIKPTQNFMTYKVNCVSFHKGIQNKIYDMHMIDSPGYGKNEEENKKWLKDMTGYINNKVIINFFIFFLFNIFFII